MKIEIESEMAWRYVQKCSVSHAQSIYFICGMSIATSLHGLIKIKYYH